MKKKTLAFPHLFLFLFVRLGGLKLAMACLELLIFMPQLPKVAGITGVSHHTWPLLFLKNKIGELRQIIPLDL